MTKYGVIVGSIRENSYSKGVADALVAGLPADAEVTTLILRIYHYITKISTRLHQKLTHVSEMTFWHKMPSFL